MSEENQVNTTPQVEQQNQDTGVTASQGQTQTAQPQSNSNNQARTQSTQGDGQRRDFRGGYRGQRSDRPYQGAAGGAGAPGRDGQRRDFRRRDGKDGGKPPFGKKPRNDKRPRQEEQSDLDSQLIEVKRVTRVVKGGKRMRFAALVVVGDRKGQVGMGFMKGVDFQDAVAKATRKAKDNLIKITISEDGTIGYPIQHKFKSANLFMKPATKGTGLIAGGYLRPVLELAGVENIYTKIIGSNNKISGVQAAIQALQKTNK